MSVKLLTEQCLEFLSLKGGCTGSSESTLVKMPHCWKSHVMAHLLIFIRYQERTCQLYIGQAKWENHFFFENEQNKIPHVRFESVRITFNQ